MHPLGLHRHSGPSGPQAPGPSGLQSKAAPRSAPAVPPGGPCEPPPRTPEREPRQSSSSNRVGLCVQVVAGVDARKLVGQQPGGREELLDGRDRRQDLAAPRAARPRRAALTLRAHTAAGARPHTCTADTCQIHPRCMRARCTCGARQVPRTCTAGDSLHTHGACTPQVPPKHGAFTPQVPPEQPMRGAPLPAAALPPAASPAPPAVGAVALSLILSPSLMVSSQPRRRPPSPRRRAAPPRRRPTSPRADASPRAGAPPTRADALARSPPRRAARPGPRRRA